jgi:chromate transporter
MEEKTKSKGYVLRKLFFACLYLSTFTFGGGYVIVTLLKEKFVDHYHWIEEDEMLDLVAIAQSSPGAIAVNGAIIVGYKLAGIPGMLVSVIGAIIPPMVILSVISVFYDAFCSNYYIAALLKGMTAGVGAVIMSVVYDMGKNVVKSKDWVNVVIMIISFCLSYFLNVNTFGSCIWNGTDNSKRRQGKMIYIQLFLSFLQVGALSFGGGYAAMPLIQEQVVNLHSWLSMSEFTNLITIAEMTPGPIAVNSATFVGMQIAGILGAIIATLGCILPSCIIVTLLAYVYMKYRNMSLLQGTLASLRPAVVSMIAKAGVTILISAFFIDGTVNLIRQNVCVEMIIFFVIALVLLRKFKINPILAMVLCGVANVVLSAVKKA